MVVKKKDEEEKPKKRGRKPGSKNKPGAKSNANSTSFKKGQPNPVGRAKADHSLRDKIRANNGEVFDILMKHARSEDPTNYKWAIDHILQRGWGKVQESFDPDAEANKGTQIFIMGNDAKV